MIKISDSHRPNLKLHFSREVHLPMHGLAKPTCCAEQNIVLSHSNRCTHIDLLHTVLSGGENRS